MLFYEAELRRRRRERAEALVDINHALSGGQGASQHLRELLKG